MEMQVEAERRKRAQILDSEGLRQSMINQAEAERQQQILASEAVMIDQVNSAKGEAEALKEVADATAYKIRTISEAINEKGGQDAVSLKIAEKYIAAFSFIAKENNTVLLPADLSNPSSMIANAMTIYQSLKQDKADQE